MVMQDVKYNTQWLGHWLSVREKINIGPKVSLSKGVRVRESLSQII